MNNKIYTYSLLLLLPVLPLFSCTQEDMPDVDGGADDQGIVFHVSLPATGARSTATTMADDLNDGFYVSAFCPEDDVTGTLNPYITELSAKPLDEMPDYFGIFGQSDEQTVRCIWPTTRHGKKGQLKFFAFYPSREVLRQSADVTSDYFGLENSSKKQGTNITYDYRIKKFRVNRDISRHIDFVTATADGSRRANGESSVRLDFEHQLSRVAFNAWGNTDNDIEIAGMRIGRAITESDFNFAAKPTNLAQGDNTVNGNWVTPQVRDRVEYIFREGDAVVKIGNGNHTSAATAASIMGNGGWAMVIPADNTGWNHTKDKPNNGQGLYFSVLLRVKENDGNRTLLYPYVAGGHLSQSVMTDAMEVFYMSIDKETGKIMKRLYRNKEDNKYYTDPGFSTPFTQPETEEIRNYGWAAIPLSNLRWKPGYQYTYTLDYSGGVGVHDPADPYPGTPIISKIQVSVTETGVSWPTVYDFTREDEDEVNVTDNITIN